jgi:two-component system, chemotaxis family, chemotaxis protein CheY
MKRFFIDYTTKDQSLYDYQGEEFLNSADALDFAEATAQALKNSLNGDWIDWTVQVRNAEGVKLFSLAMANANAGSDQPAKNLGSLLIIEDAPVHSAIISRVADKVGFITTRTHSYEDACEVLSARQFDCITLDLGLGEHVGFDILRYLSTIGCRAQIVIISQSDKGVCDDVAELGRGLDLSVYECVPKPIDLEGLRETLLHIQAQALPLEAAFSPV